ncbi:MAG: TetR/AcrR family transcriptional regulator [Acidimicrobiia bacterium]
MTVDRWKVEEAPAPTGVDGVALRARGERTRRALLEAAEEVFAQWGWENASIVKITQKAGVSQGTFYRYFVSKQAVFDELVADLNRRVRRAMSAGVDLGKNRLEAERLGFEGFFRFTAEHPALYRVIRQAEFASPTALHLHYERIAEGYQRGLSQAMANGEIVKGDPEVLAYVLMGIGELVGMRWILWNGGTEVPKDVLEEMMRFIMRGLGADL